MIDGHNDVLWELRKAGPAADPDLDRPRVVILTAMPEERAAFWRRRFRLAYSLGR